MDALERLFPDLHVLAELAPEGWEQSPLVRIFHPTLEQRLEEHLRINANIARLRGEATSGTAAAELIEETLQSHSEEPADPEAESVNLLGMCLWDIFGEHEVTAPDGTEVDLGSWRGSAHTIADWLNGKLHEERFDHIDFYMGSQMLSHRADLSPAHALVFRRMQAAGYDWRYHFPRLNVVTFSPEPDEAYLKMKADLDLAAEESRRAARTEPPPEIVAAYKSVYGRFPLGWPP